MCSKKVGDCNKCIWDFACDVPADCPGYINCEDCRHWGDCDACISEFTPNDEE